MGWRSKNNQIVIAVQFIIRNELMIRIFFSPIRSFYLVTVLLILVEVFGLTDIGAAQEKLDNTEMEEALSGFDNEDSLIEEALSGFDEDESAKDEKKIISGSHEYNKIQHTGKTKETSGKEDWNTFSGYAGISLSYGFVKEPPEDNSNSDWSGLTKIRPFFFTDM